ncbi:Golgi reassembly stacking protein [Cryptosporidium ubiquitum]|uniref:Golgi reassembly stacking protein n=1 Tax=Cryptosporidium ubiquitum TaxID=857276 RepID=A0A1J4MI19_9CRYT|nr:Golgi reassembly stacking protein [Cryptosporidium ubiquitum]OII73906.1 Golgi reassembly stacking protein [Cryptosporidium ubiquitum]
MGGAQTKQLGGFRVCNYGENSLGRLLELERSFDYIVGIDGVPLTQVSDASHDFFLKRLKGVGKYQVKINIYNSLSTRIRTIILNPYKYNEKTEGNTSSRRCSTESEKDGLGKNAFVDGIESNMVEFDAPLNSLRVYQFLSYDDRISGLGIGVHWEEISTKGIKIVNVQDSSPAQASGLISNEDFIVASSTLMRPFYSTDDFLAFVKKNDKVSLSFIVYNTETEVIRELFITPDSNWGGKGLLGCDIAAGPLYDIPLREKEVSFSKPHHGNITYIEVISESEDGQGPIRYSLKEENEVISKDILQKEESEDKDISQQSLKTQLNKTSRENLLVKDYSFDLYRIKQSEESQFDEKQDIIEQALINSGINKVPDFSDHLNRGPIEVPNIENNQEDSESHTESNINTSESFLIISDLNEQKDSITDFKSSPTSSDEGQNIKISTELSSNHQNSNPTQEQGTPEIFVNPEVNSNEVYDSGSDHLISISSAETSQHQTQNQIQNSTYKANSHCSNSSSTQQISAEDVSEEKTGAPYYVSKSSSEPFPANSPKSEVSSGMHLHADLHVVAGTAHLISGESTEKKDLQSNLGLERANCENKDLTCIDNHDIDTEDSVLKDLRVKAEGVSKSETEQRGEFSLALEKEDNATKVENQSGPVKSQNDQIKEINYEASRIGTLDSLGERHEIQEKDQEQIPCKNIEIMSPEDERACEILKKLIEIHPRLDYDPPGTIEYTDQGEI